ncbi:phage tail tip lysozyme [Methylobacterium bullatum]|uniref:Phage tail lysozyme domain-containing protein n=1 Tax=Methylobacterium bullatum TaxID=570505 RepID=A0A679JRY3_9HYPH|nr:hypothetical protein MBLL_00684 [Methylobacterium bullatum]
MADENNKVQIHVDAKVTGEDQITSLAAKMKAFEAQAKRINDSFKQIGRVQPPGGRDPAKTEAALEGVKTRGRRSKKQADADSLRTAQRINLFDRESVKLFQTKLTSQTKAATESLRAERQSFANFRTRNEAQSRYESGQVRALKDRLTAERRISSMRMASERAAATAQARTASEAARAATRRMQDAANAIRATARLEEAEARRVDRARTSRENARGRYISNVRSGANEAREGAGRAVRGAATVAAATRKGIDTRLDVDTAETNLKIFSGQTNEQIKAARKGFLDNLSIRNGLGIAGGLDAYSEVLKTGMKAPAENVKTIMEAVSALELDLKNTTKLAGLIDRNYGAKSDPAKIKSALNAVAVAAREDPTQSNEIVEGVKRAFGALSTGNMTPEQLTALVSGGQSVGIQPGKAGTYVATLGKQLSMGNSKFLGKKNRDELNFAARELGFGDARKMASDYAKDSYGTMMKFHENLAKLEAGKRTQVAEAALGRQWSDEGLQFSQGTGGVKKTYAEVSDPKNANFLEEAARIRAESLQGQWNSTKTIFGRFWDAFGQGFEDILNSINKYFLDLNSKFEYDQINGYVVSFLDGVKEALGVKTWQELLHNTFGGDIGIIGPQIKAFAKGLTEGVMSIGRAIKSFASIFGGSDMSADTMGKLTGEFLAMSLGLAALSPVIGVLGGLAAIVGGIATSAAAISALGTMGGGTATAAGAAAVSGWTLVGTTIAAAFVSYLLRQTIPKVIDGTTGTKAGTAIDEAASAGGVTGLLGTGFNLQLGLMKGFISSLAGEKTPEAVRTWSDPPTKAKEPAKSPLDPRPAIQGQAESIRTPPAEQGTLSRAWDWITSSFIGSAKANEFIQPPRKPEAVMSGTVDTASIAKPTADPRLQLMNLTHAVEENTSAIRAGLDRQGIMGGLIQRASISTASDGVKASLAGSSADIRSASSVLSGSTGSGTVTGGLAPLEGSVPGTRLNGGSGLGRRGIIGGAGSYAGSGPGGGVTPPMLKGDAAANAKTAFDFFKSKGLSTEAASGILASIKQESNFTSQARGDGGRAHGVFQHHADRRAAIQRATGINMSTADLQQQLEGAWWEMQNGDAGAQRALRILRQPGISARDAGGAFVQHFERPARDERASRGAMAEGFARQFGSGGGDAVPSSANDNATSSQVLQTARNLSVANQQCVSLAKAAVGASGSVMNWQRGVSAEAGTLKPGTPVATFMDALGRQSSRYAGGGTGTMGANRDHAGIFQEYIKDAAGKNIGMRIAEQYRGSGGVHSKDYMFGQGSGAKNGSNYNVVLGPDGQPLGDSRNPMNRTVTAKAPVVEAVKAQVSLPEMSAKGFGLGIQTPKPVSVPNPGKDIATAKPAVPDISAMSGEIARNSSWKSDAIKSWKPSGGNKATAPVAVGVEAHNITGRLPGRNADAPGGIPVAGGGNVGNSSSSTTTNNININGSGLNSQEIANAVQRKASEGMRRQSTGASPYSYI